MKRKIEAKMKGRGITSHETQQLAARLVDKNEDSSMNSPDVQNPEAKKGTRTPSINGSNGNTPIPHSGESEVDPTAPTQPEKEIDVHDQQVSGGAPVHATISSASISPVDMDSITTSLFKSTTQATAVDESTIEVNDEEARLLAELKAERLAEEKARQKRCELEDRLAIARGKKRQRSASIISERGTGDQRNDTDVTQDSTSSLLE
jgi:hypothetical protein